MHGTTMKNKEFLLKIYENSGTYKDIFSVKFYLITTMQLIYLDELCQIN
jgi:hypothetical protein